MNILKISITPKKGFQHTTDSSCRIKYHALVALQQLSMTTLLPHGKCELIYPPFTEGLTQLRLSFVARCRNYKRKACTQKASIEKITQLGAQESHKTSGVSGNKEMNRTLCRTVCLTASDSQVDNYELKTASLSFLTSCSFIFLI